MTLYRFTIESSDHHFLGCVERENETVIVLEVAETSLDEGLQPGWTRTTFQRPTRRMTS